MLLLLVGQAWTSLREAHFLQIKSSKSKLVMKKKELTAETIVINTGAVSNVLPIPGLATSKNVFDSTGIQNLDKLPENLEFLVAEISVLNFARSSTTNLEARLQFLDA